MTKRDTLTHLRLHFIDDGAGGSAIDDIAQVGIISAHVSMNATSNEITMYGVKTQWVLHVVTDTKLEDTFGTRYGWSGRIFKIMQQNKSGNEWFSTLLEVNN